MNLAAQQHHNAFEVFYNFLIEVRPARILEIGTALGGFTQFLKKVSDDNNLNIDILTYDIYEMDWYESMRESGIDVKVENIFNYDYTKVDSDVIEFIQKNGITIVLCDGGNKVGEFNLLSKFIKKDDFILAHDYVDNRENFIENYDKKIWNWHEISDDNINNACLKNNLEDYNKHIFNSVVWVCKIKK